MPIFDPCSVYFHIPFCTKKCPYCHFYVIPNKASFQTLLKEAFHLEWQQQIPLLQNKEIVSIYFGGGTPSLYNHIESILTQIPRRPDCEITIEANPEEGTLELFSHLRSIGINRLSLGIQSLDDRSLQTLERVHSAEKAKQAVINAEKSGFQNISIDLMYDLPGQTEQSWGYTLDQIKDLPIQHLSLYNLTIEPHTAFHKRKVTIPTGDLSLRLHERALRELEQMGLHRYEISAFSRPGYESRHNLGYWTGRPFLGFGPSAFSYWNQERFRNVANINRYANLLASGQSPVDFRESLPYPANVKELLAIHIRLKKGVNLDLFKIPEETKTAIEKLKSLQLVVQEGAQLMLTDRGRLFYDTVATEII